jgi:hypothetical protein
MTTSTNRTFVLVATAVMVPIGIVAAFTAALLRGDSDEPPPGSDSSFSINPTPTEPNDVAVHVMSGLFTWQPAIQASSWDALHSQQDYLTGTLAQAAAQPPTPAPQPISEWSAWARSRDTVTAVVRLDGEPSIDVTRATIPVVIMQTVQHSNRESTPYTTYTATVQLENYSGTWKASTYQLVRQSR